MNWIKRIKAILLFLAGSFIYFKGINMITTYLSTTIQTDNILGILFIIIYLVLIVPLLLIFITRK